MNKIIVDIDVWNCQIRAFKPKIQTLIPNDDIGKQLAYHFTSSERLNNREFGYLKGNAQRKALRVVNKYAMINMSGWYGSIESNEKDFIKNE